ncbi:MAG: cytidylate kinase-like family protein [Terriglobia bacterium]|jgi:cytidylate kinase|nr:cytidylate kinase-like family protein [Terriglobia bacterium]
MIRTITLAREYGTGGGEIAQRVARRLGWDLIDRSLIDQISEKFHVSPRAARELDGRGTWWLERIARAVWLETGGTTVDVADAENIHEFTRNAILEASYRGKCVIVGRGGQCVLRDRPDVLHVFLFAPLEYRLERLRRQYASEKELLKAVARVDEERSAYIREFHDTEWKDPLLYHLWINAKIGIEAVTELIVNTAKAPSLLNQEIRHG